MSRDIYIAQFERIRSTLVEAGCPESLADEIAAERAYPAMRDQLADMADTARMRAKEQQ